MLAPMAVLAALCFFVALGAPLVARVLDAAVTVWAGTAAVSPPALRAAAPLAWVSAASAALLAGLGLVLWWLVRRTRADAVDAPVIAAAATAPAGVSTWDCGYAAPSARMQYTSSSFAEMLVGLLDWALRPDRFAPRLEGPFPPAASFHTHVPDTVLDRLILPTFSFAGRTFARLRPIQRGNVHLYLLYILGTLLALLLWR
jgi:hydrogenase-4 component B